MYLTELSKRRQNKWRVNYQRNNRKIILRTEGVEVEFIQCPAQRLLKTRQKTPTPWANHDKNVNNSVSEKLQKAFRSEIT